MALAPDSTVGVMRVVRPAFSMVVVVTQVVLEQLVHSALSLLAALVVLAALVIGATTVIRATLGTAAAMALAAAAAAVAVVVVKAAKFC